MRTSQLIETLEKIEEKTRIHFLVLASKSRNPQMYIVNSRLYCAAINTVIRLLKRNPEWIGIE